MNSSLEDGSAVLLRETFHADLEEILIFRNLLSRLPMLDLIHIPIGPEEAAVQEFGLGGSRPDGRVACEVCCSVMLSANRKPYC